MPDGRSTDVIVVGGGVAGLGAAALVARSGLRVVVCERASSAGGRARTQERSGFHMNQGPHALYVAGPADAVLRELDVAVVGGTPAVSGSLALDGPATHALPGGPVSLLTTGLFGLAGKIETARVLGRLPRLDPAPLASVPVASWVDASARHPGVRRMLHATFRLATYAHAPETMSAGLAVAQLQHALRHGVRYLDGGWQTMVDGLHARATAAGAVVRTGAAVAALAPDGRGVRLRDGTVLPARAVVIALDAAAAAPLLPEGAARRIAVAAQPVRAACLDVALSTVPRPAHRFALGIDEPVYYSLHSAVARLAPAGGGLIHVARYLGDASPEPRVVERQLESVLDRVQPGWRDVVVERRFLPDMVAASALATASSGGLSGRPGSVLAEAPGVFLAGDWIGPHGWLADASLASAREAAGLATAWCARAASAAA